jgi:hypothetical protein
VAALGWFTVAPIHGGGGGGLEHTATVNHPVVAGRGGSKGYQVLEGAKGIT